MIRATIISAVRDFLADNYEGPVAIHPETSAEEMLPPYAVVRIGGAEQMAPGQVEIWDVNILIAVFHDAEVTTASDAETNAAGVFAMFDDPDGLITDSAATLIWSALERIGSEASVVETRWQHVAGFRGIVAPVAAD